MKERIRHHRRRLQLHGARQVPRLIIVDGEECRGEAPLQGHRRLRLPQSGGLCPGVQFNSHSLFRVHIRDKFWDNLNARALQGQTCNMSQSPDMNTLSGSTGGRSLKCVC